MQNNVLSPLTMVMDLMRNDDSRTVLSEREVRTPLALVYKELVLHRGDASARTDLANSLEAYLRRMVAACATHVHVPYKFDQNWMRPRQIQALLAPTTKKAVKFIDRRDKYWEATTEYLKPISERLGENRTLSQLAWDLYLLVLSVKYKSEVVLPPERVLASIAELDAMETVDAEGRSRLSALAGIFRLFQPSTEGPTLKFTPGVFNLDVTERIQEILEDAYLLEASRLRRFLGLKQNVTSVRRDLRKVLSYIVKKRHWAKGLVGLGSTTLLGGDSSAKALDKLAGLIPAIANGASQPVLVSPVANMLGNDITVVQLTRCMTRNGFSFVFTPSEPYNLVILRGKPG